MTDRLKLISSSAEDKAEPWFSQGLKFKCTGCGDCCTGSPGYVWVSEEEIHAIAKHLNLSIVEFRNKYIRQVGQRESLLEHPKNFDCIFLKDRKCQIYTLRPKQCRTFPWWVYNLRSEADWNQASRYCEGINHPEAPLISLEEIEKNLH